MERVDPCFYGDARSFQWHSADLSRLSRTASAMKRGRSAKGRIRLGEVGEDTLLASLLRELPGSHPFIGDDCAMVPFRGAKNLLVLKTDCVVEKIHFKSSVNPELVGWKAMMRPLSDFAAV